MLHDLLYIRFETKKLYYNALRRYKYGIEICFNNQFETALVNDVIEINMKQ
jgi:hypothetical protein